MENKVNLVEDLRDSINNLDKEIEDLSNSNIINSSKVEHVNKSFEKVNNEIKKIDKNNRKAIRIRNLKIFKEYIKRVFPYTLIASILLGLQVAVIGDIPFYPQKVNKIAVREKEINSESIEDNRIRYEDPFSMSSDSLKKRAYYTTSWQMREDGKYHRTTKEYSVKDFNIYEYQLVANNPNTNLLNVLDREMSSKEEVKTADELSSEELASGNSIKFVIQYKDKEDYIIEAQDLGPNIGLGVAYLAIVLPLCLPTLTNRLRKCYCFSWIIEDIIKETKLIDTTELKKLFKEKKIKLSVVKHEQVTMIDPITKHKTIFSK